MLLQGLSRVDEKNVKVHSVSSARCFSFDVARADL
jgi:hypothetical protein